MLIGLSKLYFEMLFSNIKVGVYLFNTNITKYLSFTYFMYMYIEDIPKHQVFFDFSKILVL